MYPKSKGPVRYLICLMVPSLYLQDNLTDVLLQETAVIHNCTKPFIQNPHFIEARREESLSKDTGLPGENSNEVGGQ